MLTNTNDYPTTLARRMIRGSMFRSGLSAHLGPLYWQPTNDAAYIHVPYRKRVEMFRGIPSRFSDESFTAMIGPDSARWSLFEETITAIENCWVEPNRCHIIGPDGRLVQQSLTHRLLPLYPSIMSFAARHRSCQRIKEAVVYDGFNSINYFHHLIETLPSLILLNERGGIPCDLPYIVNRWVYESRFFAYLREISPEFAEINWMVQEPGEWIHVDCAYRIAAAPFDRQALSRVRDLYGKEKPPKGRRIFLSRDSKLSSRSLRNEQEVSMLLAKRGFETVYAEHLSLDEQQRTFEEATHLVALHGMGLVQQLFMTPSEGHILELMPSDRLHSVYYWQAWTQGMTYYDVHVGSPMDSLGRYEVNARALSVAVDRMLEHPITLKRYGETLLEDQAEIYA